MFRTAASPLACGPAPRPARRAAGGLIALGLAVSLTACANPLEGAIDGLVSGGVENIIEEQTGVDVDVDTGEGGSGASLPASWPTEIPVVDGRIMAALSVDGTFSLTVEVADSAVAQSGQQALLDAGFTTLSESDFGEGLRAWVMEKQLEWVVGYTVSKNDDGTIVQYSVTPDES